MSITSEITDPGFQSGKINSEEFIRASVYHVLSRGFSSPLEMDRGHLEVLEDLLPYLQDELESAAITLLDEWKAALKDEEKLTLAYTRLFLGPFIVQCPAYASIYLEPDQKLMGEVSAYVADKYATAGLGPGEGPREAPDHITLEWEFMYYLTYRYIESGEAIWSEKRSAFYNDHMLKWLPAFSKRFEEADSIGFYRAVFQFMSVVIREIRVV